MKNLVLLASGIAAGDALYQAFRTGVHEIDWVKVGFMFVFSAVVFAVFSRLRSVKERAKVERR